MDHQSDLDYHIRWNAERIDWEQFDSREQAEQRAGELEIYSVEQIDDSRPRCRTGKTSRP